MGGTRDEGGCFGGTRLNIFHLTLACTRAGFVPGVLPNRSLFRCLTALISLVELDRSIIRSNKICAERGWVGVNHTHYEGASLEQR